MAGENGSGSKAFGGVVAIVAVISGIVALQRPTNQRLDFLTHQIDKIELEGREDDNLIRKFEARMAAMEEKSKEVETQFKGVREYFEQRLNWKHEEIERLRTWTAEHDKLLIKECKPQWRSQ